MSKSIAFYFIVACLLAVGAWGLIQILNGSNPQSTLAGNNQEQAKATDRNSNLDRKLSDNSKVAPEDLIKARDTPNFDSAIISNDASSLLDTIHTLVEQGRYFQATRFINENYSRFSSSDLEKAKNVFLYESAQLVRKGQKDQALNLSTAATSVFNDLETWRQVSQIAIDLKKWKAAFEATLKASLLETGSIELQNLQAQLVKVAANYRARLEQEGNSLSVHQIYDALYKAHSSYPRFQLELAFSYIRLERDKEARPLLEQLQYDGELGEISRNTLEKLNAKRTQPELARSDPSPLIDQNNITIPLKRLGTNLIAEISIDRQAIPLLLDTGASITALDTRLINRLNLQPTGQTIQISTANGVRNAQLYRARRVQLGQFLLRNHVVAGIDLGQSRFSGLLGTDLLNSVSSDYSYLIDNQKSALIFRPRN